jgi:uncharacterized protein YdeI (YjbR/CyaY-like superfamily)
MKAFKTVDEYILSAPAGKEILMILRDLLKTTELDETIKWGTPVYTIKGKNVVGLGAFKSYTGLWFFQGALLKDKAGVLTNAQEDQTKALRQWRFTSAEEIDADLLIQYVSEAIENERQNRKIEIDHNKPLILPHELKEAMKESAALADAFNAFTPGRQREFAQYINEAKQEKTRQTRLEKVIPLILDNIGLNDKYRK